MDFSKGSKEEQKKGTWWIEEYGMNDGILVIVKCPNGHISTLRSQQVGLEKSTHHIIDSNGEVNPSVICPREVCEFHAHIKLLDWKEP